MRRPTTERWTKVHDLEGRDLGEARCICPDPVRWPSWRHKACPVHQATR